jgi:hypothetical protein
MKWKWFDKLVDLSPDELHSMFYGEFPHLTPGQEYLLRCELDELYKRECEKWERWERWEYKLRYHK